MWLYSFWYLNGGRIALNHVDILGRTGVLSRDQLKMLCLLAAP